MPGKDKVTRWMRAFLGPYDLSGDARTFGTLKNTLAEVENTGWSDEYHRYLSDDQRSIGVDAFQAIMNDAANRSYPELTDLAESEFSLLFGSGAEPTYGDAAYMLPAIQVMDDASFDGGIAVINSTFLADADQYAANLYNPFGRVMLGNVSQGATIDGDSFDWSTLHAPSLKGGWALLQITASDGGTWVLKVQDSANDAAWADLITFAADGSAVTSEVGSVAGSVDRYTRAQLTRTSGTVSAIVTFARNL